jgi:hypothetical protein
VAGGDESGHVKDGADLRAATEDVALSAELTAVVAKIAPDFELERSMSFFLCRKQIRQHDDLTCGAVFEYYATKFEFANHWSEGVQVNLK